MRIIVTLAVGTATRAVSTALGRAGSFRTANWVRGNAPHVTHCIFVGASAVLAAGLAGAICFAGTALAQETPKPLPFGRYELVKGQDNPVCLAVGEQVKEYKFVKWKIAPHQNSWFDEALNDHDARCDFPLSSRKPISVPQWRPFDPIASSENWKTAHDVYNSFVNSLYLYREFSKVPDALLDGIIDSSSGFMIDQLAAWKIVRFQIAEIDIEDSGSAVVYRVSSPTAYQNCWSIGFDSHSKFSSFKYLPSTIRTLFQIDGKTYYIIGPWTKTGEGLEVRSFDNIKDRRRYRPQGPNWDDFQTNKHGYQVCHFQLRESERMLKGKRR